MHDQKHIFTYVLEHFYGVPIRF